MFKSHHPVNMYVSAGNTLTVKPSDFAQRSCEIEALYLDPESAPFFFVNIFGAGKDDATFPGSWFSRPDGRILGIRIPLGSPVTIRFENRDDRMRLLLAIIVLRDDDDWLPKPAPARGEQ